MVIRGRRVSSETNSKGHPLSTVWPIIIDHHDAQKCRTVGKSITGIMTPPPCLTNTKFTTVFLVPSLQCDECRLLQDSGQFFAPLANLYPLPVHGPTKIKCISGHGFIRQTMDRSFYTVFQRTGSSQNPRNDIHQRNIVLTEVLLPPLHTTSNFDLVRDKRQAVCG